MPALVFGNKCIEALNISSRTVASCRLQKIAALLEATSCWTRASGALPPTSHASRVSIFSKTSTPLALLRSHPVLNCTSALDNTSPMATPTDHDCKESLLSDGDTEVGDADLELHHGGSTRRQIRLHWFWIAIVSTAVTTFFATRAYYTHPSRIERAAAADTFCMRPSHPDLLQNG